MSVSDINDTAVGTEVQTKILQKASPIREKSDKSRYNSHSIVDTRISRENVQKVALRRRWATIQEAFPSEFH